MSDDWQAGDLALCIKRGRWRDNASNAQVDFGPKAGQVSTVLNVSTSFISALGETVVLNLSTHTRDLYAAHHFIKLRPHKLTEDDREVIEALKAKRVGADA